VKQEGIMRVKIIKYVKAHPFRTIGIIFLILIILPPLLIAALYKIPAFLWILKSEIPAGNLLSYWGTVLTFCATFSLSVAIYIQNRDNAKNAKLMSNEALIIVSDDSLTEIILLNPGSGLSSLILNFNVIVMSKATISNILLNYLSFEYDGSNENRESHIVIQDPQWNRVHFQRKVTDTEFSISFIEIPNELTTFFKMKNNFVVRMQMEILCNDVITPIAITAKLKRLQEKCEKSKSIYSYEYVFVNHGKPRIK
jgi:hypothetical protein